MSIYDEDLPIVLNKDGSIDQAIINSLSNEELLQRKGEEILNALKDNRLSTLDPLALRTLNEAFASFKRNELNLSDSIQKLIPFELQTDAQKLAALAHDLRMP